MKWLLNCIIASALFLSISHMASDQQTRAQEPAPSTVAELLAAMKLTESQQAEFQTLERHKRTAEAGFRGLAGAALQEARNAFYAERQATLKEIFTEEQMALWTEFWKRPRNATPPGQTRQPAHVPTGGAAPVAVPALGEPRLPLVPLPR